MCFERRNVLRNISAVFGGDRSASVQEDDKVLCAEAVPTVKKSAGKAARESFLAERLCHRRPRRGQDSLH